MANLDWVAKSRVSIESDIIEAQANADMARTKDDREYWEREMKLCRFLLSELDKEMLENWNRLRKDGVIDPCSLTLVQ